MAESETPESALVSDLMTGAIDAAVRGTLPANATLQALRAAAGVNHLERIALLETAGGKKFLFAPVGIDEGWTVADKLALIRKGRLDCPPVRPSGESRRPLRRPFRGYRPGMPGWTGAWPRQSLLHGSGMQYITRS